MKSSLYPKLAFLGIKKNRRLYLPYILSCIGMVMMGYIVQSLSYSPVLRQMRGGANMEAILSLGKFVIAAFAIIFLFYTNSFLVHRRFKEFGLYSILGMGKKGIAKIVLFESLIVALLGLTGGIGLGILFSKFAELGLLNAIRAPIDYSFNLSFESITFTAMVFGIIFILITIKSLITVAKCNPLELLNSEKSGEKPPKANWALAIIGALLLIGAYIISITIESPLSALTLFFVAVIMVIAATYMLFIAGSVALCRILQKNKKYYYKKNHFVSVSSMSYRMKRNGAGLASICILATMVLVMAASTASLYFGMSDTLKLRFPQETQITVDLGDIEKMSGDKTQKIRENYEKTFKDNNFTPKNVTDYKFSSLLGIAKGSTVDVSPHSSDFYLNLSAPRNVVFVSLDDYNSQMKTDYKLDAGQALIYTERCDYTDKTLSFGDTVFSIVGKTDSFVEIGDMNVEITPIIALVIRDYGELSNLDKIYTDQTHEKVLANNYYYGFDNGDLNDEEAIKLYNCVQDSLGRSFADEKESYSYSSSCLQAEKGDFYTSFGGLFFIGIILSIIFIFAAAVIIYYKQVSEGYEDCARFSIMQKVGMTKADIKKSINSQILTVFFTPLLFAGLHFGFAFPLIWKILQLFHLRSVGYVILISAVCFAIFGLFYIIIYKLTARAYFAVVSSDKKE